MNLITEDKIIQGKDYKISGFADKAIRKINKQLKNIKQVLNIK